MSVSLVLCPLNQTLDGFPATPKSGQVWQRSRSAARGVEKMGGALRVMVVKCYEWSVVKERSIRAACPDNAHQILEVAFHVIILGWFY